MGALDRPFPDHRVELLAQPRQHLGMGDQLAEGPGHRVAGQLVPLEEEVEELGDDDLARQPAAVREPGPGHAEHEVVGLRPVERPPGGPRSPPRTPVRPRAAA